MEHMVSVNRGDLYDIRLARRTDYHAVGAHLSSDRITGSDDANWLAVEKGDDILDDLRV